jgi:hypothetical protein
MHVIESSNKGSVVGVGRLVADRYAGGGGEEFGFG